MGTLVQVIVIVAAAWVIVEFMDKRYVQRQVPVEQCC